MSETVIQQLIGLATVIVGGVFAYLKVLKERKYVELAKKELTYRADSLGFHEILSEWNEIHHELRSLIEETSVDRFLLFRAWNGELTPQWTTNIFQFRESNQTPVSYVNFELDEDYVNRLRKTITRGNTRLKVEDLPPSAIRDVYEAEGVTDSVWFHIDSTKLVDSESRAIVYCSFATHNETPLTDIEITRCRLIVGRLKAMSRNMNQETPS
jgi:hypothetical protein